MRRPPQWTQFPKYPVTAGTIVLAAMVTIAWWLGVDVSRLVGDSHVGRGEVWRFVTDVLPHVNIIHLLFNVIWLWTFGTIVEGAFGHWRTLGIFVFFAICSSAAEYAILNGGVGLSGVGYGLFGLLWVLHRRDERFADAMDQRVVQLFIGWFFLCIFLTVTKVMPVGNIAHGVGAGAGAALGWCITQRARRGAISTSCIVALLLLTTGAALFARPYVNFSSSAGHDEAARGYAALKRGDNADAARLLAEAARLNPREPIIWYDLGIAYQRLERYSESLVAYEHAYQLDPHNSDYMRAYDEVKARMQQKRGRE